MTRSRAASLLSVVLMAMVWVTPAAAQEANFEGKTIRMVVGFSPGGGFDAYARAIARHYGKYLAGKPTVVVDNMPGAGSLIAAIIRTIKRSRMA